MFEMSKTRYACLAIGLLIIVIYILSVTMKISILGISQENLFVLLVVISAITGSVYLFGAPRKK